MIEERFTWSRAQRQWLNPTLAVDAKDLGLLGRPSQGRRIYTHPQVSGNADMLEKNRVHRASQFEPSSKCHEIEVGAATKRPRTGGKRVEQWKLPRKDHMSTMAFWSTRADKPGSNHKRADSCLVELGDELKRSSDGLS